MVKSEREIKERFFSSYGQRTGEHWSFWFRIYGYGLAFSTMGLLFSERNGYSKVLQLGKIKVKWLRPERRKEARDGK